MSDISANIVVETSPITIQTETNPIGVTVEPITLNVFNGGYALPAGNLGELQYNGGGLFAGVPNTSYANGNLSLGNVANLKILGGVNGYVLQTDGTGNLSFTAQTGNAGNGTPGGSNTQIQYNDSGSFGGAAGFTFDEVSNLVNMPGELIVVGNVTADNFIGNFSAANVANANYSNYANFANFANIANTAFSVNAANVNGSVASAINANTVTENAQPNITSVGTLTTLNVSGNITSNGIISNNYYYGNGNIINFDAAGGSNTEIQYNNNGNLDGISTVTFNGTDLRIYVSNVKIGDQAGNTNQAIFGVAVGYRAGTNAQGNSSIAIGTDAGEWNQGNTSIAIGFQAGGGDANGLVGQGSNAIAIGRDSARISQGNFAIAIGKESGNTLQGSNSIAIGTQAGLGEQGINSIAIGVSAGRSQQQANAIAIGYLAGNSLQNSNTIAIGTRAGFGAQANNSIVLNATGANLNANTANALFIKPVRSVNSTAGLNQLYYDSTTGEIVVYIP